VGEFAATKPGPQTRGQRITKVLPYVAALVLVAGGIAFLIAYFGTNTAHETVPKTPPGAVVDNSKTPANVPVPNEAKSVAAEYITSGMTRQNLPLSWKLTHPSLKQGYTYKQWLTGNIPVQFFPRKAFNGATYKVQWSHPNDVMLNVYIFGKPASLSQAFFIELKPVGEGSNKRWRVSYIVPNGGAQNVPALSPDGG
jgi:hypothetical protein